MEKSKVFYGDLTEKRLPDDSEIRYKIKGERVR